MGICRSNQPGRGQRPYRETGQGPMLTFVVRTPGDGSKRKGKRGAHCGTVSIIPIEPIHIIKPVRKSGDPYGLQPMLMGEGNVAGFRGKRVASGTHVKFRRYS